MGAGKSFDMPGFYRILVREKVDPTWASWFGGLEMSETADSGTSFAGMVGDQTELFSLIRKFRDLGLTLVSLERKQTPQDQRVRKEGEE